jgi:hypothetical protein
MDPTPSRLRVKDACGHQQVSFRLDACLRMIITMHETAYKYNFIEKGFSIVQVNAVNLKIISQLVFRITNTLGISSPPPMLPPAEQSR